MKKALIILMVLGTILVLSLASCQSHSGSRAIINQFHESGEVLIVNTEHDMTHIVVSQQGFDDNKNLRDALEFLEIHEGASVVIVDDSGLK